MTKAFIDELIQHMKKAEIVTKAAPWMVEGIGSKQMHVRYVGIKPYDQWKNILSEKNNLLIKFVIDRTDGILELYLANTPPFIKITTKQLSGIEKWEVLLGEIGRRLYKDKEEYIHHREQLGNIFSRIASHVK